VGVVAASTQGADGYRIVTSACHPSGSTKGSFGPLRYEEGAISCPEAIAVVPCRYSCIRPKFSELWQRIHLCGDDTEW
jgi:hypothetical protein